MAWTVTEEKGRVGVPAGMDQTIGLNLHPFSFFYNHMNHTERIKTQELRRILYDLRQRFGVPADFYKVSIGTPDLETGDKNISIVKTMIPQLVISDFTFMRKFQYSIAFIKANANFGYGGYFEVGDAFTLISGVENIQQKDYIVYNNKRYNMQKITPLTDTDFALHVRLTSGETFNQIHNPYVRSTLDVEQVIDGV